MILTNHNKKTQNWIELRFKKDRGFEDIVIRKLYKGKKKDDLSDPQLKIVDGYFKDNARGSL